MKKVVKVMEHILLSCIIFFNYTEVSATAGKLRSSSIITCNGVIYGQHGDGHWHKAVRHKSGYYPSGSPVTPPCLKNNNSSSSKNNNSTSNSSSNMKVEESVNLNIKSILINNESIDNIKDIMDYTTYEENINLEVTPEDKNATIKINGNLKDLEINKVREIKITITNSKKVKDYILNITRRVNLENYILDLSLNDKDIILDKEDLTTTVDDKNINFNINNLEGVTFKVYKDEKELIDNKDTIDKDTTYRVVLSTDDSQTKTYNLNIKYQAPEINTSKEENSDNEVNINKLNKETSNNEDSSSLGTGILTIGGLGALGYYLVKKKK